MLELKYQTMKIEMPDKSVWGVPVDKIAQDRANYYKSEFNGNILESLSEDTIPLFNDDTYSIQDWAVNNMNWEDVEDYAQLIEHKAVDFQEGWVNGEKTFE